MKFDKSKLIKKEEKQKPLAYVILNKKYTKFQNGKGITYMLDNNTSISIPLFKLYDQNYMLNEFVWYIDEYEINMYDYEEEEGYKIAPQDLFEELEKLANDEKNDVVIKFKLIENNKK